jgi:hypothetical protein
MNSELRKKKLSIYLIFITIFCFGKYNPKFYRDKSMGQLSSEVGNRCTIIKLVDNVIKHSKLIK